MGEDIVFPAAAFMAMAVEAIYQSRQSLAFIEPDIFYDKYRYKLRNVTFPKALVLEENVSHKVMLTLGEHRDSWYEFKITSSTETFAEHCHGYISIEIDPKTGNLHEFIH